MGNEVVAIAREWIGTPVKWEASLKGKGCDCRGLLAGVARELGRPEANEIEANLVGYAGRIDEAKLLAGLDRLFNPIAVPGAGDILALRLPDRFGRRRVQHLAIHAGDGRMIHAYFGDPALVCEVPIGGFWGRRIAGAWAWR